MILSTNIGIVGIVLKSRGNVERIKSSKKKFSLEKEVPARQPVYNDSVSNRMLLCKSLLQSDMQVATFYHDSKFKLITNKFLI
jgi:hypothetical protein